MSKDWDQSAVAWINSIGTDGDFGRKRVLDEAMTARITARNYWISLDVGCGEGRFCRNIRKNGMGAIGLDPAKVLLEKAVSMDVEGCFVLGVGAKLPFADDCFDLVVSYLSLIDIEDYRSAISEMARVVRPSGAVLVVNLSGMHASAKKRGWKQKIKEFLHGADEESYSQEHMSWHDTDGIRVKNWHRPLSAYIQAFLKTGLELRHFEEPLVPDPQTEREHAFNRAPWFTIMEWHKPVPEGYAERVIGAR